MSDIDTDAAAFKSLEIIRHELEKHFIGNQIDRIGFDEMVEAFKLIGTMKTLLYGKHHLLDDGQVTINCLKNFNVELKIDPELRKKLESSNVHLSCYMSQFQLQSWIRELLQNCCVDYITSLRNRLAKLLVQIGFIIFRE
jgi:hypothetical protein